MAVTIFVARRERELAVTLEPRESGYVSTIGERSCFMEGTVGPATRFLLDGRPIEAGVRREGALVIVEIAGRKYSFRTRDARAPLLRRRSSGPDHARGELHAPMPGLVIEVLAEEGDTVEAGRPLVVVEAMKMQNEFVAPLSGRVTRVAVRPGMAVESGQLLVAVAPESA